MTKRKVDPELAERVKEAKRKIAERGHSYEGLGEAIDSEGREGPDFGPRNDIEYRKLIKEIRESGNDE